LTNVSNYFDISKKIIKKIFGKFKLGCYLCIKYDTMSIELPFIEDNISNSWLVKVNERLTLCLLKIKDHNDITEEDYELLRVLYGVYENQDYPLYRTKPVIVDTKAVQQGLFMTERPRDTVHDDLAQ
jgi:hypothetical protein